MPCGATQDRWVMVERSDRMWSTEEGNGKPLQYSCLENPMNSMKRQKDWTLKDELPRSVGAQYATEDQWRNNSRTMKGWSQSKNNTLNTSLWINRDRRRSLGGDFPSGPVAKTLTPNAGGPSLIPGQGTGSHMSQLTMSSPAATKDPACCNEDGSFNVLWLTPGTDK